MLLDTDIVLKRIVDWQLSHGGTASDLVVRQHKAVFDAAKRGYFPLNTFLPLQCWYQLTGKNEPGDLIQEYPEDQLDYSQVSRWNPNKSMDCSSWADWNARMWLGRSLGGTYTETQWRAN